MQLSKQTIDIAKNFAAINSNFLVNEGTTQMTISASKDIMAEVEFAETMPTKAGIFNLGELLGVISLFDKPEFEFSEKSLVIKENGTKIKYMYADESLLTVPTKKITMPTPEIKFDLSFEQLSRLQKASSALSVDDLAFVGDGKAITAKVFDVKNPTSNSFEMDLDVSTTSKFEVYFKLDKLSKLYPGSYGVEISSQKISLFTHKDIKLKVYIAIESQSKF